MSANMYRVGDYVFFETSSTAPYQIRRIEELNKTQNGNVEAKVMCFYRRRDISNTLIVLADKHHNALELEEDDEKELNESPSPTRDTEKSGSPVDGISKGSDKDKTSENGTANGEKKVVGDGDDSIEKKDKDESNDVEMKSEGGNDADKKVTDDTDKKVTDDADNKVTNNADKKITDDTDKKVTDDTDKKVTDDADKKVTDDTNKKVTDDTDKKVTDDIDKKVVSESDNDKKDVGETNGNCSEKKLDEKKTTSNTNSHGKGGRGEDEIPDKLKHQLKHRELFLSRQVETLPATHIRGKCCVTLLNETESLLSYLNKDDMFFYSLVYDPQQKTLLADKGEIRVGSKFQADMIPTSKDSPIDDRRSQDLEELVWDPNHKLDEKEIDQFQIVARSVGTFARALDCTSTVRQPSLHMSAAAASRDITIFHAMDTLHKHTYQLASAIKSLVPSGGPALCRDEMEEWSASEANLFEDAIEKYGKDFSDIRQDFLPWKSLKSIVEYYYMWKTTDRYVQQKRIKASEAESKLKQVYIPNYNKPNPAAISNKVNGVDGSVTSGRACESCYSAQASQWYAWGPVHLQCRLCNLCWGYWKKYGGLKMPTRLDGERPAPNQRHERVAQMNSIRMQKCTIPGCGKEFKLKAHLARHLATAHGLTIQPGSPRPVMKTRAAFCLVTTELTRISRRLCHDILRPKHAARCPFTPINTSIIKQECQLRLSEHSNSYQLPAKRYKNGLTLDPVVARLGIDIKQEKPSILARGPHSGAGDSTHKDDSPQESMKVGPGHPSIMKKRGYEQTNGVDAGPPVKRPNMSVVRHTGGIAKMRGGNIHHNSLNGRSRFGGRGMKMHMVSWMDMPDDVYFVATDATRKLRKQLQLPEFKRLARNPWKKLSVKPPLPSSQAINSSNGHPTSLPQDVVVLD